jgi:gliding motility-associated-like protein
MLNLTMQDASCNGGADGRITATGSGGTGTLQYSIDGINFQVSGIFNVLPGTYAVTVKDANNCTASQSITVGLSNNLNITPAPDVTICEGSSAQLNVSSNANQFSWSPATALSNATIQNPVANPVTTTQYIVTATFGLCSAIDTIIVNVNRAPVPDAGPDGDICYGQSYRLQGSGGVQFAWSPSASLSSASVYNPLSTPAQTTTYSLSVIDANGCPSLVLDQVVVKVTPPIVVRTYPSDTVVFAGDQFQLLATSAGTNYTWSPPAGLSNPFVPDPVLTVTSDVSFNVIATTSAGCRGDGTVTIKVYKGPDIYMPTGFTPNGDGKNDKFKPFPVGIVKLNYFRVYNRWGQLIFSTNVLHEGWDGRLGGVEQSGGTYVWMVQGVTRDGRQITKKGTVTLIR